MGTMPIQTVKPSRIAVALAAVAITDVFEIAGDDRIILQVRKRKRRIGQCNNRCGDYLDRGCRYSRAHISRSSCRGRSWRGKAGWAIQRGLPVSNWKGHGYYSEIASLTVVAIKLDRPDYEVCQVE